MSQNVTKPARGLGRGLASLIPTGAGDGGTSQGAGGVREIPLASIRRNPYQPRERFHGPALDELAASVREHGILQPIVVIAADGGYQLVAGERRTRAAELAGLTTIPAVVRSADEQAQLSIALVENLQRADLDALEEARAYRRLMDEFGCTQEEVARRVGRSRSAVANTLRLLATAPAVQEAVAEGRVTEGHARAIAALDDPAAQVDALARVEAAGLSVRDTERLVRESVAGPAATPARRRGTTPDDPDLERLEGDLRDALGTRVTITPGRQGGRITITWFDDEELGRLVDRLTGGTR